MWGREGQAGRREGGRWREGGGERKTENAVYPQIKNREDIEKASEKKIVSKSTLKTETNNRYEIS